MAKKIPSERQQLFLKRCVKITPPPSEAACDSLIKYILRGKKAIGKRIPERIGSVRKIYEMYCGKPIYYKMGNKKGVVQYILAKTLRSFQNMASLNNGWAHSFELSVKWEDGSVSKISPHSAEVLKD
jgi:hypothetical protein